MNEQAKAMTEKLIVEETELATTIRPKGGNGQNLVVPRILPILRFVTSWCSPERSCP